MFACGSFGGPFHERVTELYETKADNYDELAVSALKHLELCPGETRQFDKPGQSTRRSVMNRHI